MMNIEADMVFEASWEVVNKCGGIHTVISTKASLMQAYYDNYFLIGPLKSESPLFIKQKPTEPLARIFASLASVGIRCEYGSWDIQGRPATILIDASVLLGDINSIKGKFWNSFGVDSINAAYDFDEPMAWACGVGMFLEQARIVFSDSKILAHFHEWLAGGAILYLKDKQVNIPTVFTTHATMLGRSLSGHNTNLFDQLGNFNPDDEARRMGVMEKFSTERACAQNATIFTTVSDATAKEAEFILGRKPLVTPNGLPLDNFPTFEDASFQHVMNKKKLYSYIIAHFFPYYTFDLTKSLLFYYGGRYEYHNKGMDVTIDALATLNHELKESGSKKTIVMFFFIATGSDGPKRELYENKERLRALTSSVQERSDYIIQRLVLDVLMDDVEIEIMPQHFVDELRREFRYIKRAGDPPLCTHKLQNEDADPVVAQCKRVGLLNRDEDRVKIVMVPAYLDGSDGLFDMDYYEAVSGCHLGIFPSYYEPWGYTPLESLAYGVPAVTSTTSGFGQYIQNKIVAKNKGLYLVDTTKDYTSLVHQLFSTLNLFAHLDKSNRVSCKINAHALATFADWRQLIRMYLEAHNKAMRNETNS